MIFLFLICTVSLLLTSALNSADLDSRKALSLSGSPALVVKIARSVAEADQIVTAIRKNGKPVDYLVFPDEGHGMARPENRLKFYALVEDFLHRHLK
jgi:hypothetical protein